MRKTIIKILSNYLNLIFPFIRYSEVLISALFGRVHENDFFILKNLPKNLAVVDIGANLGQSVTSLSVVLNKPNILSLECNPACLKTLSLVGKINSFIRGTDFNCVNVGLGDTKGKLSFLVPAYNSIEFFQEGFLKRVKADHSLISKRIGCKKSDLIFKEYIVEICTLDSFFLKPDLLKVDVQGAELDVLKSSELTIRNNLPLLFIELLDNSMEQKKLFRYIKNTLKYKILKLDNNCLCYHRSSKLYNKCLANIKTL
jgi:FkbM family methyltransferase